MKKLFYGLGVVAFVFAASLSFGSCNDAIQDDLVVLESDFNSHVKDFEAYKIEMQQKLEQLENDYKRAIADAKVELNTNIGTAKTEVLNALRDSINNVRIAIAKLDSDLNGKIDNTKKELQNNLDSLEARFVDTLSYYVTYDSLTIILEDYATIELLEQKENELKSYMNNLDSLTNARVDADSIRIDSLFTLFARVEALEASLAKLTAAVNIDDKGHIALSDSMVSAIWASIEAKTKAQTASALLNYYTKSQSDSNFYKKAYIDETYFTKDQVNEIKAALEHYADSIGNKGIAYTDEQIQLVKDSIGKVYDYAKQIDTNVNALINSLAVKVQKDSALISYRIDTVSLSLETFKSACNRAIAGMRDSISYLYRTVDTLKTQISGLDTRVNTLEGQVKTLLSDVSTLKDKVDNLIKSFEANISSLIIQGTYNNVFGSIRMPLDVQSLLLAGHYGQPTVQVQFPEVDELAGFTLEKAGNLEADGLKMGTFELEPSSVYAESAGFAYLTVNPNTANIKDVKFEIVNSLDEPSGFVIDNICRDTTTKLSFGWTRAANNGFYRAHVVLEDQTTEGIAAAKPRINFQDIKGALKTAINSFRSNRSFNLKELAKVIYENSTDILDANAVKATWTDGYGKEHSVYSDYGMATTVMKPLSYQFEGFDTYADKLASKMNKLKRNHISDVTFETELKIDIKFTPIDTIKHQYVYITYGDSVIPVQGLDKMIDDMNATFVAQTNANMDAMLKDIEHQVDSMGKKVTSDVLKKANSYVAKVNNYIDKFNNYITKIQNKLTDTDFNHYLQPCLMTYDDRHFGQVSSSDAMPSYFKMNGNNYITLVPTSYTSELIAPAMMKFIAVTEVFDGEGKFYPAIRSQANKNSSANFGKPFDGKQQVVLNIPQTGLTYEILYQAVDFSGQVRTNFYYIRAID